MKLSDRRHLRQVVPRQVGETMGLASEYKLQALIYRILSPVRSIIGYAIGLRKLSANWQLLGGGGGLCVLFFVVVVGGGGGVVCFVCVFCVCLSLVLKNQ